jgi:hypothetical protein
MARLYYDSVMRHFLLAGFLAAAAEPISDPAAVDVCQRVPGAEVAKLFGKTLKDAKPTVSKGEFSRCRYLVTNPGTAETVVGYSLGLYPPGAYDELLEYTEGIVENPSGFGDAAVLFKDEDGLSKLRLVVREKFGLEAVAADAESAKKLARLALERFSR